MRARRFFLAAFAICIAVPAGAEWFQDRDNSMVDANDAIGDSMVFVSGFGTYTLGTKLYCPAQIRADTYIMTGHGLVDRAGHMGIRYIDPFPIDDENYADDFAHTTVTSPWLNKPRQESERFRIGRDYAIVTVRNDPDLRHSNVSGIIPIEGAFRDIVKAKTDGVMSVQLYRGRTRYQTDNEGKPLADASGDFLEAGIAQTYDETKRVFDVPQRVVEGCDLARSYGSSLLTHSCPTERSVSGAQLIAGFGDRGQFLLGIHLRSSGSSFAENFNANDGFNSFLPSGAFCEEYEAICGQPCMRLDQVLP